MSEESLFHAARHLADPAARAEYLDANCHDGALRARVEALLAVYDREPEILRRSVALAAMDAEPGTVIGPYTLQEQIGAGGFGAVFLAEQTEPVRRRVALKLIKPGMDTKEVIARFEAERQALALMDHPNIAKVLDAGATGGVKGQEPRAKSEESLDPSPLTLGPAGRPYFVMEYVEGESITDYCDAHRLSTADRLQLFVDVCHAVQHAHQKGVIHRDLKPTNILVAEQDGRPLVKVIDFGIAKAAGELLLTDKTLQTGAAQMIGTPLYMSPEQATLGRADLDTRSDIYSLGAVLYELLAGCTPFDRDRLRHASLEEMQRIIREEEPRRPSLRLSALGESLAHISTLRRSDPPRLAQILRGDLDWIVMKALEKDRDRRYESAGGFARDIERYLGDEPVEARPPSAVYRLRKFARRNRRRFAMLTVTGLALLISLAVIASSIGWVARDRVAQQQRHQLEVDRIQEEQRDRLARSVEQELSNSRDAYDSGNLVAAKMSLDRAASLEADMGADSGFSTHIDQVRRDLEMVDRLEQIRLQVLSADVSFDDADQEFSDAFTDYGIPIDPAAATDVVAEIQRQMIVDELVTALDYWIMVRTGVHQSREPAMPLVELVQQADPNVVRREIRLVWQNRQPLAEADLERITKPQFFEALDPHSQFLVVRSLPRDSANRQVELLQRAQRVHPDDVWNNMFLAFHLRQTAPQQAVGYLRAAVAIRPNSPFLMGQLADVLLASGDALSAIDWYRAALEREPLPTVRGALNRRLALAYRASQDPVAAAAALLQAADEDTSNAKLQLEVGRRLRGLGRSDEAVQAFRRAVELEPELTEAWSFLGFEEHVAGHFHESLEAYEAILQRDAMQHMDWYYRGQSHAELGMYAEAVADFEQAARLNPQNSASCYFCAVARLAMGDDESYQGVCDELLRRYADGDASVSRNLLAVCILSPSSNADWPALIPEARTAVQLNPGDLRLHSIALLRSGQYEEAAETYQPLVTAGRMRGTDWCFLAMALQRLGRGSDAKRTLNNATNWTKAAIDRTAANGPGSVSWYGWHEKVEFRVLLAEAEALLYSSSVAEPPQM